VSLDILAKFLTNILDKYQGLLYKAACTVRGLPLELNLSPNLFAGSLNRILLRRDVRALPSALAG
jgi:hypothetical protein